MFEKTGDITRFFDNYSEFYKSQTRATPNRLNKRFLALIHNNRELIKNSIILDLASHDGRWSFAAIKNGAKKVVGIEVEKALVHKSIENMERYGIQKEKYSFITGDILKEIKKFQPNEFDIIFCFGIFYHIMNHMLLLSEIKRLNPKHLIIDSTISNSKNPIIEIRTVNFIETIDLSKSEEFGNQFIEGRPSKSALEIMLKHLRFDFEYYDWENSGITNWEDIHDYHSSKVVSPKKAIRHILSTIKKPKPISKILKDANRISSLNRITLLATNQNRLS